MSIANITLKECDETGSLSCERKSALDGLATKNNFSPLGTDAPGPFDLTLSIQDNRLVMELTDAHGVALPTLVLSLRPYARLIRDYFMMIESYETARRDGHHMRLEAIDMGRRGLHNEGAELLQDRLKDRISMDFETARRLFTLICALYGGRGPIL